jgi:hypothetical protein
MGFGAVADAAHGLPAFSPKERVAMKKVTRLKI